MASTMSDAPSQLTDHRSRLVLPAEIWEQIMQYLSPKDISSICSCSKQHLDITRKEYFRASNFLQRHRSCQAIYEASCCPRLLTPNLLKILLNRGAIMSRHFVQCVSVAYMNRNKFTFNENGWATQISFEIYTAILHEAFGRYGEHANVTTDTTDLDRVRQWIDTAAGPGTMSDEIREIFTTGKFAPFKESDDIDRQSLACLLVARCSTFLKLLKVNGYDIDEADCDEIATILFGCREFNKQRSCQVVRELHRLHPSWQASATVVGNLFEHGVINYVPLIILEDHDESMLIYEDCYDFGSNYPEFEVIKELRDEGIAFGDLQHYMTDAIYELSDADTDDEEYKICYAGAFAMLYGLFPELLQEFKEDFALTYVKTWLDISRGKPRTDICKMANCIRQDHLLMQLKALELEPAQMRQAIFRSGSCRILSDALKVGLLEEHWFNNLSLLITTFAHHYIRQPLTGTRLPLLIDDILKCNNAKSNGKIWDISEQFITNHIHQALCDWIFDLDKMSPDSVDTSRRSRFKTPIGWLIEGRHEVQARINSYRTHTVLKPLDPYNLAFESQGEGNPFDRAEFFITKQKENSLPSQGQSRDPGIGQSATTEKDLTPVEPVEANQVEYEREELGLHLKPESYRSKSDKLGLLIRCRCEKYHCSMSMSGENSEIQRKETARALLELLDEDSPGIRDVLLAHALVNGNVELLEVMMEGQYDDKSQEETAKSNTRRPVLPTLAHLLILQKLQRRPLDVFVNSILRGAPFKRGYVKSPTLFTREKEVNLHQRQEWYIKKGYKDDRPLSGLFREKSRLQELDESTLQDSVDASLLDHRVEANQVVASSVSQQATEQDEGVELDSDTEDKSNLLDVEEELDLKGSIVEKMCRVQIDCNGLQYDLTLSELIKRKRSVSLWKDHLELLQWLEEREEKKAGTASNGEESIHRNDFFNGLKEMLKKVDNLELALDSLSLKKTEERRKEVVMARQAKARLADGISTTNQASGVLSVKRKDCDGESDESVVSTTERASQSDKLSVKGDKKRLKSSRLAKIRKGL